jgi:hypothetical protein
MKRALMVAISLLLYTALLTAGAWMVTRTLQALYEGPAMRVRSMGQLAGPSIPDDYSQNAEQVTLTDDERLALAAFDEIKIGAVKDGARFRSMDVYLAVDSYHGDTTPYAMGQGAADHLCVLFLHIRDSEAFRIIMSFARDIPRDVRLRTGLAHEAGHCVHGWRSDSLPLPFAHDTRPAELFADYYALAWTARYHPADFDGALKFLVAMRKDRRVNGPMHPTANETAAGVALRDLLPAADIPRECANLVLLTLNHGRMEITQ